MSPSDMEPYVGYYINDIAAKTNNLEWALWNVALLTYVHFYQFKGVQILFQKIRTRH